MTTYYYGGREFRFMNEASEKPDSKYIEYLDSKEGLAWLDSLVGDSEPEQPPEKETTGVDAETATAADKLAVSAKAVIDNETDNN